MPFPPLWSEMYKSSLVAPDTPARNVAVSAPCDLLTGSLDVDEELGLHAAPSKASQNAAPNDRQNRLFRDMRLPPRRHPSGEHHLTSRASVLRSASDEPCARRDSCVAEFHRVGLGRRAKAQPEESDPCASSSSAFRFPWMASCKLPEGRPRIRPG